MKTSLPLFPLPNVVLFPGMMLALHIFEDRYRQMMQDVMSADARFGILLCREYNPATLQGTPFGVGTVAEIMESEAIADGRWNIVVTGRERFRVVATDETSKPYLQGEVEPLEDLPGTGVRKPMLKETQTLFLDTLRMTYKILGKDYTPQPVPESAEALSFYIAESLKGSLVLKQELLELQSTRERLERERDVLKRMVQTLAVRTQIEDAFRSQ